MKAFERFAPAVLQIYRRDKEAFWAAVMAPFLSDDIPVFTWCRHINVALRLLAAAKGLENEGRQILQDFCKPLGLDVTKWKSSHYFKDFYPIFAFLVIWMEEQGLSDILEDFDDVLRAAVFGVTGYGILDLNTDGNNPSPVEILTSQALIAEYETIVLQVFGVTEVNLGILHQMRSIFLRAEIKEKLVRGKASPYRVENPKDCGAKAAHVLTPFMLSLERLGKAASIDDYWEASLLFSAVVQILDDWTDLEKDLNDGHYSYVTLGAEKHWDLKDPEETAKLLREDKTRVVETYHRSQEMLSQSRSIFARLNDPCLVQFVNLVELRYDSFCRKKLKMDSPVRVMRQPLKFSSGGSREESIGI